MSLPAFVEFAKIGRLTRDVIVTEKIDGTNACIFIPDAVEQAEFGYPAILAGSRSRWLGAEKGNDNFGFGAWVAVNSAVLLGLGPGRHFGEWWGQGIQRGYGLDHKRFSLFNPKHYAFAEDARSKGVAVYVVPTLTTYQFDSGVIEGVLTSLRVTGSVAAPGFMRPEGIVVFHTGSRTMFKETLDNDDQPKGVAA